MQPNMSQGRGRCTNNRSYLNLMLAELSEPLFHNHSLFGTGLICLGNVYMSYASFYLSSLIVLLLNVTTENYGNCVTLVVDIQKD